MKPEVINIMKKMNLECFNAQLAMQCAPLFSRLKPSNLLILPSCCPVDVPHAFLTSDISSFLLYSAESRSTYLLYLEAELEQYLKKEKVKKALWEFGYFAQDMQPILLQFKEKYGSFLDGSTEFPHEMGLLLGYPPEDVLGFVEHAGKDFLYSGYWKVYSGLPEKIELFRRFDLARECAIHIVHGGGSLPELLSGCYQEIEEKKIV